MNIQEQIQKYLEARKNAWAITTIASEKARLLRITEHLNGNAEKLWNAIQYQKPYSRVTTWVRVTAFWEWMRDEGIVSNNPYKKWKKENARQFKHVYTRRLPEDVTFSDAHSRIASIKNECIREQAKAMLQFGLRFIESTRDANGGVVIGKGNKRRGTLHLHGHKGSYQTVRRGLKAIGLKPHDLRKLFASECAKRMNTFELMKVMGWSNLNTAQSYVAAAQTDELLQKVKRITEEATHGTKT